MWRATVAGDRPQCARRLRPHQPVAPVELHGHGGGQHPRSLRTLARLNEPPKSANPLVAIRRPRIACVVIIVRAVSKAEAKSNPRTIKAAPEAPATKAPASKATAETASAGAATETASSKATAETASAEAAALETTADATAVETTSAEAAASAASEC
jgi:hypothetical protein